MSRNPNSIIQDFNKAVTSINEGFRQIQYIGRRDSNFDYNLSSIRRCIDSSLTALAKEMANAGHADAAATMNNTILKIESTYMQFI